MSVCLGERVLNNGQVSHVDLVHTLGTEDNTRGAPVNAIKVTSFRIFVSAQYKTAWHIHGHHVFVTLSSADSSLSIEGEQLFEWAGRAEGRRNVCGELDEQSLDVSLDAVRDTATSKIDN